MTIQHPDSCSCCGDLLRGAFSRRRFLQTAAASGTAAVLSPYVAFGAQGNYEAMVVSCIDPRFQRPVADYLARRRLTGKYSSFVIAGAGIGVVAEPFKDWHKAFWDNLATSIELHRIKSVIAIDHRDCGAAKIAYGDAAVANRDTETATHRTALNEFRKQCNEKQPNLKVETLLIGLNRRVQPLS
jgi:carbonic anhydrase